MYITKDKFRLSKRVDRMEGVIGNIVSKIDMVLIKLESMEKSKESNYFIHLCIFQLFCPSNVADGISVFMIVFYLVI